MIEVRKHRPLSPAAISSVALRLGVVLSLLRAAHEDDRFTRNVEATAVDQQDAENEALGFDDAAHQGTGAIAKSSAARSKRRRRRGPRGLPSAAVRIRAMHHRNRSLDEKRWVALDAVVNPTLYHHVTPAEAEEMQWDVSYYTRLDREDILRVLSLPIQVHLALPFLHTPDEINAHELLGHYTLGVAADHFSRLDKNSQDFCMGVGTDAPEDLMTPAEGGGADTATATEVAAAADNHSTPGKLAVEGDGSVRVVDEDGDVHSFPRTLACMRRSAQVQLKTVIERDLDEAVWLALDKKLRPEFYDVADEVAGDEDDKSHREADAKEDARHAWLNVVPMKKPTSDTVGLTDTVELGVTEAGCEVDGEAGAEGAARREFMATQVAKALGDAEVLKQLTSAVLGDERRGTLETRQSLETLAGNGCIDNIYGQDAILSPMGTVEVKRIPFGSTADGCPSIAGVRSECPWDDGTSSGWYSSVKHAPEAPEGCTDVNSEPLREEPGSSVAKTSERNDVEPHEKELAENEQMSASSRLNQVATRALSLFLVREEETPIGRDKTRSLAMLQEAALRLGRGQTKVMRGLNQQVAIRALFQATRFGADAASSTAKVGLSKDIRTAADALPPESGDEVLEAMSCGAHCTNTINCTTNDRRALMSRTNVPGVSAKETTSSAASPDSSRWGSGAGTAGNNKDTTDDRHDTERSGERTDTAGGTVEGEQSVEDETVRSERAPTKTYGSWQVIHPASLGVGSQERMFASAGNENERTEERVHPASFQVDSRKGMHSPSFRRILIQGHSYNGCRSV